MAKRQVVIKTAAQSSSVDTRHPLYAKYKEAWRRVKACVAGEDEVRSGKTKWLPHPDANHLESDPLNERYNAYQQRAVFMNATGRTLAGCLGIVFGKPATLSATGALKPIIDDCDGEGKPLSQMVRDALSENLQTSRCGILVDYTSAGVQTLANPGRVVFKLFNESQIINWRVANQRTTMVILHYEEAYDDPDSYEHMAVKVWDEYRIREGVCQYRRHELAPAGVAGAVAVPTPGPWVIISDRNGNPMKEIPFCWIGGENNDAEPDTPILGDIAGLNIKHYCREADIAEASHICGLPTLFITGLTQAWVDKNLKKGITLGSTQGVPLPAGADAKLVQAEERNILILAAERIEKQLAMLGAKLVERGTAARTAAQANDEAQTDNSILSLAATNVERAFMKAFEFASMFAAGAGEVVLSKKYDVATYDSQVIQTLMGAVQSGQFMLEDFVRHLQREGLVDAEVDPEQYASQLRDQMPLNSMKQQLDENGNPIPIGQIAQQQAQSAANSPKNNKPEDSEDE